MDQSQPVFMPLMRPRLPSADELLPYLRRIDASRRYSNGGPLVCELERRLAAHFGVASGGVALVASGTVGLTASLLAVARVSGGYCMVPAWTFAATAQAVLLAGLKPWLVDVAPDSGALTPTLASAALEQAPGEVAAVIPVSPFGAPLPLAAWERWHRQTGLPVVIDGAAAFDTCQAVAPPLVLSLHATKVFGIGEGGLVISTDETCIREVIHRINFGFAGSRFSLTTGLNGKLSEYGAAVGLAQCARWAHERQAYFQVAKVWRQALAPVPEVALLPGWGETWVSSTCIARFDHLNAAEASALLTTAQIETRSWWERGLAEQQAFAHCPRQPTPTTRHLANHSLGLPCWPDLPSEAATRAADVLATAKWHHRAGAYCSLQHQ